MLVPWRVVLVESLNSILYIMSLSLGLDDLTKHFNSGFFEG